MAVKSLLGICQSDANAPKDFGPLVILCPLLPGELYVVRKGYAAAQGDEITLKEGETLEVIHKLLDGWWVVR